MVIKLFELGFVLRAIDKMTGTLASVQRHIEGVNEAAKKGAGLREFSENLGMVGAGAIAAGGALGAAVYSLVAPAAEMQATMAHVATAVNDGAATMQHLNDVQRTSEQLSSRGVMSAENLAQGYYIARSNMLGHAEALQAVAAANDLVTATTQNAAQAQAAFEPTVRTLTTLTQNLGGTLQSNADMLAKLQTSYAFKDIEEVTNALQYAMPSAKGAGMSRNEMEALVAMLSAGGLHGAESGTAAREMIAKLTTKDELQPYVARTAKGGLDLERTLGKLKAAFGNLAPLDRARELKALGFNLRDVTGVEIMIDKVGQLKAVETDLANSAGSAAKLAKVRMAAADEQWDALMNNLELLREALGENLLPAINNLIPRATAMLQSMTEWAHAHKGIVKLGLEIAAVGAAILIPLGSLAVFLASLGFIASYIPLVGSLVGVFKLLKGAEDAAALAHFALPSAGWGSLVTGIRAASVALVGYASALWSGVAAGAAFLVTNPIGWAILAVAAIGALIYAIYRYRDSIGAGLKFVGTEFSKLGNLAFDWGVNLLKKFGDGIASAVMWPVHAIENVVGKMARFVVGHSPIPQGPLHDLNLGRDLARTIQPAPAVSAIRRFATTVALAAPMMVAVQAPAIAAMATMDTSTPAMTAMRAAQPAVASAVRIAATATPVIATPAMVRMNAPAIALASPGRSKGAEGKSSGVNVTIDYRPNVTVHVSGRADPNVTKRVVLDAIRDGGGELLRLVEEAMRKRSRTEF